MVAVRARGRDAERVHRLEVPVELRAVHVIADEVLGHLRVLAVLHHARVPARQPVEASGRPRRVVSVVRALVHVGELLAGGDVDAWGVASERDLL